MCCETIEMLVSYGNITTFGGRFYIFGHPDFAEGDDGYTDDMTAEFVILFCPFCGKKLGETHDNTPTAPTAATGG